MPNTLQDRGKRTSQLTEKKRHRRQSGKSVLTIVISARFNSNGAFKLYKSCGMA